MAPMVHSDEIDRGREDVFAYMTDPSCFAEWQEAVVRASPQGSGPLQRGSRIALTRRMGKREQTMTSELTEYSPPESYAFRVVEGPVRALGNGRFESLGEGDRTRFTFELDFEGHESEAAHSAVRAQTGGEGAPGEPREPEEEARDRRRPKRRTLLGGAIPVRSSRRPRSDRARPRRRVRAWGERDPARRRSGPDAGGRLRTH